MMTGFERHTKTRRAMFLEEMEQVVPWAKLCALVEPHFPKPGIPGHLTPRSCWHDAIRQVSPARLASGRGESCASDTTQSPGRG